MKKRLFLVLFVLALVVVPYLSCSSTPPAGTSDRAAEGQAPTGELSAAMARAEEARKRASDFESASYFPSDWEAAEAQYANAHAQKTPDAYNAAADAFDSLLKLTIPLYAQAREDEIMALRSDLIATGAQVSFPAPFSAADKAAIAALDQYEAGDYYAARESADKTLLMYQILANAYDSWLIRREIEEREFVDYDPDNFDRALEILSDAMDAYGAGNYALAKENADEALLRYNLVLSTGWAAYAELRSSLAEAERQAALDIKANIAVRDIFSEADTTYKTGVSSFGSQDYEEAAKQFISSETLFVISSLSASEKRQNAAEIIREANRKIEESDETARQAEIIIEGGAE
jgi:hypothetical protein